MGRESDWQPNGGFESLDVWQNAQQLAVEIHQISSTFPPSELYGITSHLRRASYSISANIAEGFGRRKPTEKAQFYKIAYGSLLETKNFLYLCEKISLVGKKEIVKLLEDILVIQKQINALITSVSK